MAHDISFGNVDGTAEIVLRNEPAWHGLGTVFQSQPGNRLTSDKVIELCPSIAFNVEKQPIYLGDGSAIPDQYATVRTDTGAALGIVGDRYTPLQNRDAFAFLDGLVSDGVLEYECAMALAGGAKVAMLARLPEVSYIAENNDPILRYLLLQTAHDGRGSVDILPTNVRTVCANTIAAAMREASSAPYRVTIRHTASMQQNMQRAADFIKKADKAFSQFAEAANLLCTRKCNSDQATAFVEALYPTPGTVGEVTQTDSGLTIVQNGETIAQPTASVSSNKMTIHNRKLDAIRDAIRHPSNQLPAMKGTWWQMLNAITYTVDHEGRTRGKNDRQRAENKFLSVMDGPGSAIKRKAMALALEMSA